MMEYELTRSARKTISIRIGQEGNIEVRAPLWCPQEQIEELLDRKREWILRNQARKKEQGKLQREHALTQEEKVLAKKAARSRLEERVRFYSEKMGVSCGRIAVREQKTRWGSCSGKGNLNFNWKLILMPPEILDYVVVHELAHRREMNHSRAFYRIVAGVLPDYRMRERWLREHGGEY